MKIFRLILSLAVVLFLSACAAPGSVGRNPMKISELGNTIWINTEDNQPFAIAFSTITLESNNNIYVGSATADTLELAISQANSNKNQTATYDSKNPGQITLNIQGTNRIFKPTDAKVAELHQGSGKILIMTLYQ